jgi:predicted glycoside hydrolase/deacetylase ChbG (UPF0249 family)
VDRPAGVEAASLAAQHPGLGVGLHVELESTESLAPEAEIERQLRRFIELSGHPPTHIDAHHNAHHQESHREAFIAVAQRHELPLRGYCGVRHIGAFFGQWGGESHPEQVGRDSLAEILEAELEDGFNELCCHPGYVDPELASSYSVEREAELATLCDPEVAALLCERGIRLVTFRDVTRP